MKTHSSCGGVYRLRTDRGWVPEDPKGGSRLLSDDMAVDVGNDKEGIALNDGLDRRRASGFEAYILVR